MINIVSNVTTYAPSAGKYTIPSTVGGTAGSFETGAVVVATTTGVGATTRVGAGTSPGTGGAIVGTAECVTLQRRKHS